MKEKNNVQRLSITAMFAALTLLATYVIKIPTPTMGYIHLGDTFVLLAGIFLGPIAGGLAAGIGSGLADLLGGYLIWVPGTFLIKFLTAVTAALLFRALTSTTSSASRRTVSLFAAGIAGETVMVIGYFLFNIVVLTFTGNGFTQTALAAAAATSLAEIPFNIVQGSAGVILAVLLQPAVARATRQSASLKSSAHSKA